MKSIISAVMAVVFILCIAGCAHQTRFKHTKDSVTDGTEKICDVCKGKGEIKCTKCNGTKYEGECSFCNGTGKLYDGAKCKECDGFGFKKCSLCAGKGYIMCTTCKGKGLE